MKKIFLSIFILSFSYTPTVLYAQVNPQTEQVFQRFQEKIEKKYSENQQIDFYRKLSVLTETLISKNTTPASKKPLYSDIGKLSNEAIFRYENTDKTILKNQKIRELQLASRDSKLKNEQNYSDIATRTQAFISDDTRYSFSSGELTGYYFEKYKYFPSEYGVRGVDLIYNNIDLSKSLLYLDENNRFNFVTDFEKKNILSSDIFFGLPEKKKLLSYVYDDMKYTSENPEKTLLDIKKVTDRITEGKSREQKIAAIYEYILENITYSQNFQLDDMYIYSALEGFMRSSGVCTSYSKLMSYMLGFAGISDFEVIRGFVIDAEDFPRIGHAWMRIGDVYYDPTFDDPIGLSETLTISEYRYFGLPKDIFYTNRFDYGTLPEAFKTMSMGERKQYIRNTLQNLYPKYKNTAYKYRLFDEIVFREKYDFGTDTKFTPLSLSEKIPSIEVDSETYRYTENGKQKQIQSLQFYTLTDTNTQSLLEQIKYNLDTYTFIKWKNSNGTHEWRLGFNMQVR